MVSPGFSLGPPRALTEAQALSRAVWGGLAGLGHKKNVNQDKPKIAKQTYKTTNYLTTHIELVRSGDPSPLILSTIQVCCVFINTTWVLTNQRDQNRTKR